MVNRRVAVSRKRSRVDWPTAAVHLAAALPRGRLHSAVLAWSEQKRGASQPWGVAFSGGADSLALLLLLWAHWPERRARLVALHFNHKLRGRAADADLKFCREVCRALGVKFVRGMWRRGQRQRGKAAATPSEAEARAARLAFFEAQAVSSSTHATRELWLGHQQDDIAESMLMRLARGSGAAGLAAPRPVQSMPGGRVHLRPLLTLKKAELVAALRQAGIPWREDATNATAAYFRNRIRSEVIAPWVAAAQRDALAGAALARELLDEDDAALDAWLDGLRPLTRARPPRLSLAILTGKPRAIWRRALRRWLAVQPDAGDLSRPGFEALLNALVAGRTTRQSLGSDGFAVTRDGFLQFERKKKAHP